MDWFVMDIEANGLLEEADTIHCASFIQCPHPLSSITYEENIPEVFTHTVKDDILNVMAGQVIPRYDLGNTPSLYNIGIIGHNIIGYDLPLVEKLWGFKFKGAIIDTLVLSRLIEVESRTSHSLESWGEELGIKKPEHEDWSKLTREMMLRNREDCRINYKLFKHFMTKYDLGLEDIV